MTGSYVQRGENLDYTNSTDADIPANTLLFIGVIAALAAATIPAGETGAAVTMGVYEFDKDTNAIDAGAAVYYDTENDVLTASADNGESGDDKVEYSKVGVSVAEAAASAGTVFVRLNG